MMILQKTQTFVLKEKKLRNTYKNILKPENNVVDFWKSNSKKYPVIFKLFKQHHFVPGSSTPSERKFSHCGEQVWDRRNTIAQDTVEYF